MTTHLRIGTRGSRLALWQANHVAARLRPLAAPRPVELVEIQTTGDQVRDAPLAQIGGVGVFTKEIQHAVLDGAADVAVHSLKDLPTIPVEGLVLAAVPARGPVGDVLVAPRFRGLDQVPRGGTVATSSPRRQAQLHYRRPDLQLVEIRGNVETRLRKMTDEQLDALVLAQAGLERLGLGQAITEILDPEWMLPAVGQGALGLECRSGDTQTLALLRQLEDRPTRQAVLAERALLRALGGGCQMPIGASTHITEGNLTLRGVVLDRAGRHRVEANLSGPAEKAEELGCEVARQLLARGAVELLTTDY